VFAAETPDALAEKMLLRITNPVDVSTACKMPSPPLPAKLLAIGPHLGAVAFWIAVLPLTFVPTSISISTNALTVDFTIEKLSYVDGATRRKVGACSVGAITRYTTGLRGAFLLADNRMILALDQSAVAPVALPETSVGIPVDALSVWFSFVELPEVTFAIKVIKCSFASGLRLFKSTTVAFPVGVPKNPFPVLTVSFEALRF
jgi:hypothetical protein